MTQDHPLVRLEVLVLIAIGGFAGSNLRYFVNGLIPGLGGTLVVNVLGSFVLAALTFASVDSELLLFIGTGVCGSFTTYSSFSFETVHLWETGERARAIVNALGNLIGAGLAIGLAWATVQLLAGVV